MRVLVVDSRMSLIMARNVTQIGSSDMNDRVAIAIDVLYC